VFLCCGDALFDLFEAGTPEGASTGAIALLGNAGGSPMNVAVGLSRFGHQSCFFTKLSNDLFGQRLQAYLAENRIDTSLAIQSDLNTSLAIVETALDGSANYAFYIDNTADLNISKDELPALPEDLRVLHFGSYSTVVNPTAGSLHALAMAEKDRRIISYDPNLRLSIQPDVDRWRDVFKRFAKTANIIKASDEDIESLLGRNKEDRFIDDCFSHGAELVFLTRGGEGASGFASDGRVVNCPGIAVDVQDTVGAGDSFQAAMLHWLTTHDHLGEGAALEGEVDLEGCVQFAISAAAVTCTREGADLPTLVDLAELS